eukprot:TRINITY_DN9329_c0_g1_i2.p1 TRINITY_DN9329_c0_g1~~TRINITY_DN9329_c0_g1_i2.p1  ORF type:complete len:271 (-),score=45.65 TRINITY_DN9329_c0_g1_i2:56-868(-)
MSKVAKNAFKSISSLFINHNRSEEIQYVKPEQLSENEIIEIVNVLDNIDAEIKFLRATLKGSRYIRKKKKNPFFKEWVVNILILIVILWELVMLTTVQITKLISDDVTSATVAVMVIFQCLLLLFLILTSIKLGKQLKHKTASAWFLIQSYLSSILLFAGFYSLMFQVSSDSFIGDAYNEDLNIFEEFNNFLYFSIVTMTTVGFGDLSPNLWYTKLLVMLQMLISIVYTVVIFSKGLESLAGKISESRVVEEPQNDVLGSLEIQDMEFEV